jgi:hypothetical protein
MVVKTFHNTCYTYRIVQHTLMRVLMLSRHHNPEDLDFKQHTFPPLTFRHSCLLSMNHMTCHFQWYTQLGKLNTSSQLGKQTLQKTVLNFKTSISIQWLKLITYNLRSWGSHEFHSSILQEIFNKMANDIGKTKAVNISVHTFYLCWY